MKNNYFFYLFLLIYGVSFSQEKEFNNKAKIVTILEDYFSLERETIHLHLNKTVFLTDEDIWFGGYIINRKKSLPHFSSNIFIVFYDENGTQISEQLVFGSSGSFTGKINLDQKLKSGNYYIHAYTNWMNNFNEDESTVAKVTLINTSEGVKNFKRLNKNSLEINLTPEGGNFINGIENTLGISLLDCRGNTIDSITGNLETVDNKFIKSFTLNQFGYGKTIIPISDKKLKVSFYYQNEKIEKTLPSYADIGIGITINNFKKNETIINIKTNSATQKKLIHKKLFLLIHQDEKSLIEEFNFDNHTEKNFLIDNTKLFKGINTVRIIDEDLNQWCERVFYVNNSTNEEERKIHLSQSNHTSGNIEYIGYSDYKDAIISISTLPYETLGYNNYKIPIEVGLTVNPYLEKPLENGEYFFTNKSRMKNFELDLVLLNQNKTKYNWNNMRINKPQTNFSFDVGLAIKGKIDDKIKDKTSHKVKFLSFHHQIYIQSDVNEKGEYLIDNFAVPDSTKIDLSLLKLPNFDKIETNLNYQLLNRSRPFYKPLSFLLPSTCSDTLYETVVLEYPEIKSDIIKLEEVKVQNLTQKKKLKYDNKYGNFNLRGYKVEPRDESRTILEYLSINGFSVSRINGEVTITTKSSRSFTGGTSGVNVFVDGRQLFFYQELDFMFLSEIDEIYLNPHAILPGINNNQGIIKIYTKKIFKYEGKNDTFKTLITKGFSKHEKFKGIDYLNINQKGFDNYGVIGWNPTIVTDETGHFKFDIENFNKMKSKVIIEGITIEGEIIQQELIIN